MAARGVISMVKESKQAMKARRLPREDGGIDRFISTPSRTATSTAECAGQVGGAHVQAEHKKVVNVESGMMHFLFVVDLKLKGGWIGY